MKIGRNTIKSGKKGAFYGVKDDSG